VSALAISSPVDAINLIGNLPQTNDTSGDNINSTTRKAIGFTLPVGIPYTLDTITLRLSAYNTVSGGVALLRIFADATKTSTSPTGAILQSVVFNNPTSNSNAIASFVFTPTSTFTFLPDTRYWLDVSATGGNFIWRASIPAVTPTSTVGVTFDNYAASFNSGVSYANSTTFNSFQVDATAAPAPVPFEFEPSGGLAVLGGAWLLRKRLQQKNKN
jgi:hypothetical protein